MSVSNKRSVAGSRSPVRSNTGAVAAHRTRMGLLGSTALVAASLACSPAFAQIVASPADGGTITRTGGSAPTVNDQSGSGAVLITNVTQATTINVIGVYIDNNMGAPALDALRIEGSTSGLNSTGVTLAGANTLIASMNGGAGLYVTTNANLGVEITSSGSFFQGSYGINLQALSGYVDFNAYGQSQSFVGNGTRIAGFNAVTAINASIRLGASTFTGFNTGVNVSTPLGAFVELTGGSINALVTGVRADATNGGNTIQSQAAIVAPTGIHSTNTNGTTVTTSGAGTINGAVAGGGTGIIATSSGGTNAVNVTVGAAIGTTTAVGAGVLASTTGTSTGAINITTTAAIVASGRAISATAGTFGNTGTINIGGNVTGATGVYTNVGDYTVNVAQGVTVHGNAAGGTNAGLYLVNGAITVVNNGTVSYAGTGIGAGGIRLSSNGLVTNAATGLITGASGVWLQNSASVANAGTITGTGAAAGAAGVYGFGGANVTNTGTITGYDGVYTGGNSTTHANTGGTITGIAHGYNVTAGRFALTNTGLINTAGGTGGAGLSGLRLATSLTQTNTITNSGAITGGGDATHGYGVELEDGILTLTNQSGGVISGGIGGILLGSDDVATINLNLGSTVTGQLLSTNTGARTVTIAGLLDGAYNAATGSGVNTLTLASTGSITGAVTLGGANDVFNWQGGGFGGVIDAGTGSNDVFNSALGAGVSGSLNLADLSNFDTHNHLSGTLTLNGAAGVPGITINAGTGAAAGLLIFNGAGLTGPINVNGATVRANTTAAFGTGVLHMIDPTIEFAATGSYANDISLEVANGRQAIDPTILRNISGGAVTLAGRIYETAGVGGANQYVTFDGAGTTILTNTGNVWGGVTAINSGATLQGATNTISGGSIANAGVLTFDQAFDGTFAAAISGSGALRINAPAQIVTLSGANTYSGATTITAGTLLASGGGAIGDASTVDIASGATLQLANNETVGGLTGAGVARVLGNTLTVGGANGSTTFSGTITDQTPVAYVGSWNVAAGPNWSTNPPTYTGQEAAALQFGGSAGAYRISTAGAGTGTINDLAWYNRYGNPVYLEEAANFRIDTGGAGYNAQGDTSAYVGDHTGTPMFNYAFTGGLALGGGIAKTGTGTLTLSGVNDYTGLTSITGGTLEIQGGAAISDVGVVNVGAGGVFSVVSSETIATLTGSGSTTIAGGETLTLATGGGSYSGAIAGGVLSLASGSWTFGGVRSGADYSGIDLTGPTAALTISGTGSVTGQYGVYAGAGGGITNQAGGLIRGTALAGVYATGATTLVNAGAITSSGIGGVDAVTIVGVGAITNTGVITADANGGSGIAVTGAGSTVTNAGVITGGDSGSYGFGVQNAATSGLVIITNQSGGVIAGGMGSILLNGAGDTTINLQAGSTADGLILSYANGVHTLNVAGALNGVYDASYGSGLDTVTLAATGSMTGAYLGGGVDAFIYQGGAFTGLLDGGDGVDAFTSNLGSGHTATISISDITNFETFAHQSGQLTLTGTGFFGGATVSGGTLLVDGSLLANTLVANGGALGGDGTILGAVTVANGGTLTGVQGATLSMGSLVLSSGSTINATFSGASGPALFAVNGPLTLDGTVNIASSTGYGYGVYGLMTYGGVLTDNGLVIGGTPGGAQRVSIQTSVAGQVNIVHAPTELLFWDGGNAGLHNNGAVNGGSGVWTTGGSEWTDASGLSNGAMVPQPGFAVFQNTGGLVTVDDVNGAVGVTGMQFAADGYRVEGDSITLANAGTAIRVGNGTVQGSAWTATVASVLTGAGGLVKTDQGTLILEGDNHFTGGTSVEGGRLVVGDGAQAGSFLGAAVLANGSTLVFSRGDNHDFNNAVSGVGSVVVNGAVTLSGAITVSGGVDVDAGSAATVSDVSVTSGPAISLGANATLTVASDGLVSSVNNPGVFGAAGNAVVNLGSIQGNAIAIELGAGSSLDNAGSITTANSGQAVYVTGAGTIINRAGGVIAAAGTTTASHGAVITGVGSVTNSGLISGGYTGVGLFGGGTLSNLSGGEIRGVNGVTANAVASITNAGAITATTGTAIRLIAAGSSVTNAGAISAASTFASVYFDRTGTVTNQAGGSISNTATAVQFGGAGSVLDNAGAISNTNTNSAIYFTNSGTVINRATGAITSVNGFGLQLAGAGSSVTNLGSITAGQRGLSMDGANSTLINLGAISGGNAVAMAAGGVVTNAGSLTGTSGSALFFSNGGVVDNQMNGLIRGGINGLNGVAGSVIVTNAGAIVGLNGAGVRLAGGGSVDNLSGGSISGTSAAILSTGSFVDGVTLRDGSTISGGLSLAGGADTLTLHGGASTSGLIDGGDDVDAFIVAGTGSSSFDIGNLINFESRTMNGSGTFTLTGVDASTVGWTINGGVLAASGGAAINDAAALNITDAGTLALINDETIASLTGSGFVDLGANRLTLGAAEARTYAGVIRGSGGLTIGAAHGLTLAGANSYTGVTVVEGGLTLGASGVLADSSSLLINAAGVVDLQGFDETVSSAFINGVLNGAGTLTAGEYGLNGATINANLGAGNLFNTGGVSTLNGTSGASNVVVQAGTLILGASNRLADTATVSVAAGSILNLNAFNDTVGLAVINGALDGTGTLTAAQYQLNAATVNANLGAGVLFNLGGVSTLNGTAAATQISINAGTLTLGSSERLSDTATVTVATGATLALNGFNERFAALFGTGDVNVGAGRLTLGGAESGFGGRLSGGGSVVHTDGLFTLMGDHAIASISNTGGELRFLGTTTGSLSVSGGSLTGTGTIGGALTASNGAVVSPGLAGVQNGIGGFTAGGLTLNGSTLAIDVLGMSGGNLIDQLRINGTATLTGGLLAPTFQGAAADFDFSTRYLFLQANRLVGTFANGGTFTAAAEPGLFWRIRYDLSPNGAVLELREMIDFDPGVTGTGNQRVVGQALSGGQLGASDDWAGILGLIAGLSPADQAAAFDSISGEPLADATTSLFSANDSFLTAVRDGGMSGRDDGGEALNFVDRMSFAGGRDNVADRLGDVIGAFDPSASTARGAGGWVSAYAGDQTLDGKPGQATVESRLNGFAGGYGVRNGSMSVGAAGGVTRLEGDVASRQGHYESDLSHAAGYVAFDDGVWAADVTASFYGGDLDTRRGVTVGAFNGMAIGNTHVEGQALSASLARRLQLSDNTMIALGALATASNASVDGYVETGAGGLSLQASGTERDWQSLQLSARGTQDYRVNGERFRVYAGAGVMATTGDRQATGDMRFSGAPTGFGAFTVEGAETPPLAGLAEFGLEIGAGEGVTIAAGYRGLFSERLQDNQVGVKLKVSW